MRRIHLFAVVTLILGALILVLPFARNAASFSAPMLQTPGPTTTLRRIQVNARTIAALPRTQKYVVDLTQRGVKYEFDAQAGKIDLNRVTVRTAQREVAIGSFLEKMVPKDKLAGFKLASQSFILGTRATGTVQSRTTSKVISCPFPDACFCEGEEDCQVLLDSNICVSYFCIPKSSQGQVFCHCSRV